MPRRKNGLPGLELPRRVTLKDIAELAGVHRMTVSDALNGTGSVAPATREKVRRIAKELNYIPNFAARALSKGRTGMIAIITGKTCESYYGHMVHYLESQITPDGFHVMLMRTSKDVHDLVNSTLDVAVDGAIAVDMWGQVEEFRSHPTIPCVAVSTFATAFVDCVVSDFRSSVEEGFDIMHRAGRKRLAFIATATNLTLETEVRAGAYLAAMRRFGQEPEIINLHNDDLTILARRFKAYVEAVGCPDGIMCQNDDLAMAIYGALSELGLKVPQDVMLLGCDGQIAMRFFTPPLSTIEQPMEEMCKVAWQFLKARMADSQLPHQQVTLPGKLVVRGSLDF
jgi:DNA-binding LacI/PurR family transcriptional regulator